MESNRFAVFSTREDWTLPISAIRSQIGYVTGFHSNPHERLLGLVVDRDQVTLVAPGLEEEAARAASDAEVRPWADGTDAWAVVGEVLGGRRGPGRDRGVRAQLQRLDPPPFAGRGRRAGRPRTADREGAGGEGQRRAGVPGHRVLGHRRGLDRAGGEGPAGAERARACSSSSTRHSPIEGSPAGSPGCSRGRSRRCPTGRAGARRISEGDFLLADFGAAYKGYKADLTRTLVLGEPDARQHEVHSVVRAANEAALATVRPGALSGEIDEAARRVIRDAGYGEYFIHRIGHGLGLDVHEYPSLDPGSAIPLEENMVVTIEPGIYIPGWGGVRIEDDAVVTSEGAQLLTHSSRDLHPIA